MGLGDVYKRQDDVIAMIRTRIHDSTKLFASCQFPGRAINRTRLCSLFPEPDDDGSDLEDDESDFEDDESDLDDDQSDS